MKASPKTIEALFASNKNVKRGEKMFGEYPKWFGKPPELKKREWEDNGEESETTKKLKDAYRKFLYEIKNRDVCSNDEYPLASKLIEGINYSSEDITYFLSELEKRPEKQSSKSGLFLSALINGSNENKFTIVTKNFAIPPNCLGYKNLGKKIIIEGNVGNGIGDRMKDGEITVKGNAGDVVGRGMESGKIYVEGNAGDWAGWGIRGGEIRVKGNVENYAGESMKGGMIIVEGNAGDLVGEGMEGGEIVVKGNVNYGVGTGMKGGRIVIERDVVVGCVGHGMENGEIVVKGNVEDGVGARMKGGKIVIEGDVRQLVGGWTEGGTIYLNGEFGAIIPPNFARSWRGEIYWKGQLIFKDSEWVGNVRCYYLGAAPSWP